MYPRGKLQQALAVPLPEAPRSMSLVECAVDREARVTHFWKKKDETEQAQPFQKISLGDSESGKEQSTGLSRREGRSGFCRERQPAFLFLCDVSASLSGRGYRRSSGRGAPSSSRP